MIRNLYVCKASVPLTSKKSLCGISINPDLIFVILHFQNMKDWQPNALSCFVFGPFQFSFQSHYLNRSAVSSMRGLWSTFAIPLSFRCTLNVNVFHLVGKKILNKYIQIWFMKSEMKQIEHESQVWNCCVPAKTWQFIFVLCGGYVTSKSSTIYVIYLCSNVLSRGHPRLFSNAELHLQVLQWGGPGTPQKHL